MQPAQQARDLAGELLHGLSHVFQHPIFEQLFAQVLIGKAADLMLAARERLEQLPILAGQGLSRSACGVPQNGRASWDDVARQARNAIGRCQISRPFRHTARTRCGGTV